MTRPDDEASPLELWGGVECTVARVGDAFRDQSAETGHRDRLDDLDRIAALGIRTLRYPALWETVAPDGPGSADFRWHDERFARLQALDIRPIAGLCHHGSGPRATNLLDPDFPAGLAQHAGQVAERYPWIDLYTPVNEPLTTARFSALYGHWYPHAQDYAAFLRALLNQCKATVLAMRAIRRVRPDAGLVQTDDFGKTFATPLLAYQAEHDNDRRWLTFDLLAGRVDRGHPFWGWFVHAGAAEADLELFLEGDCAPAIIGINHYLTSERYLDQRLSRFPGHLWGGNGQHRYADAEAVRMPLAARDIGPAARLREVWERYRRPIAVTEAHHGCTRDEQLRWLAEVWQAAKTVRQEGADIRAVTIWSLFGTVDWNTLLVQRNGVYEAGPFDVRGPAPRPTALAHAAEALAKQGAYDHPVLDRPGWWRREDRFYRPTPAARAAYCRLVDTPRPILITGAGGTLGGALARVCEQRGLEHVLLERGALDIADARGVAAALACHRPWALVNAAGSSAVAEAEQAVEACFRSNAVGAEILARACAEAGIPLVLFSTDLVFDGRLGRAYAEDEVVNPTCVFGASKAEGERRVLAAHPEGALVLRAGAPFGPWDRTGFVWSVLDVLSRGQSVVAGRDLVTPTYLPDLAHVALDLLIDGARGLWHLPNPSPGLSWRDFAVELATRAGFEAASDRIGAGLGGDPPLSTALTSSRGLLLPPLSSALDRFVHDSDVTWSPKAERAVAAE